jgi:hypothetical protein
LSLSDPSQWITAGASHVRETELGASRKVLFHYDFLRPYQRSAATHRRDEALDLLGAADKITLVTLVVSPDTLRRQLYEGELVRGTNNGGPALARFRNRRSALGSPRRLLRIARRLVTPNSMARQPSRHEHLLEMYGRPGWLRHQYERWFSYCDELQEKLPIMESLTVQRFDDGRTTIEERWEETMKAYPNA